MTRKYFYKRSSVEIIHGKLIDGGFVFIDCKEAKFNFKITKLEKVKKISLKN